MMFLLQVFDDDQGDVVDFATIDLAEVHLKQILERRDLLLKLLEKDNQLIAMDYDDGGLVNCYRFLPKQSDEAASEMFEAMRDNGHLEIAPDAIPEEYVKEDAEVELENCTMVVLKDCVLWRGESMDAECLIHTTHIPYKDIERLITPKLQSV